VRGEPARYLPFLRKSVTIHGTAAAGNLRMGGKVRVSVRQQWEPDADSERKLEILHTQIDLIYKEIQSLATMTSQKLRNIRAEIRLNAAHGELARGASERERQAARVDARGLWPIWLGILLTGVRPSGGRSRL